MPLNSLNGHARIDPYLMETLNFTEADLAENRQGRLSDTQKANLRARLTQITILALLVASVPLTFVVVSIGILLTSNQYSSDSGSLVIVVIIILIFVTVMGLIPIFSIVPQWRRNRQALVDGVVASIEGEIALKDIGNTRSRRFALYVTDDAGHKLGFNITRDASKAFGEEMRYRVYFVPLIGYVVAAEELDH